MHVSQEEEEIRQKMRRLVRSFFWMRKEDVKEIILTDIISSGQTSLVSVLRPKSLLYFSLMSLMYFFSCPPVNEFVEFSPLQQHL